MFKTEINFVKKNGVTWGIQVQGSKWLFSYIGRQLQVYMNKWYLKKMDWEDED